MPTNEERPDLRDAMDRARAEHVKQERVQLAGRLVEACAGYVSPNMAIWISPGESLALQEERAGVAETLEANEEFCEAWVRKHWIPSIEAVLAVLDPDVVEAFEPRVPENMPEGDVLRISFGEVHQLYCRLMRDRGAAESVIHELAGLRRQLGRNRYVIQQVFNQLAGHVKRALQPPRPVREKPTQQAQTPGPTPPAADITRAADFSWLKVGESSYKFPRSQQALVIKVLFEEWGKGGRQDGLGIRETTLADEVGSSSDNFRIRKLFDGHPALDTILRCPSKGIWALYLNEALEPDSRNPE